MADAPPPPPLDEYERKYMGGSGPLARSRLANPWWFHLLIAPAALISLVAGIQALPVTIVPLVLSAFVLLLWVCLWYLRVAVTASHVHIQYGLFGPRIPIEAIREARAETYDWARHGGWGVRYRPGVGWAYSVPGRGGRGLKLIYVDKGREREVFVSSDRPEELVAGIERARGGARVPSAPTEGARGPRIVDEEFAEAPADEGERARKRSADGR
jgi:hypothetical protein